MSAIAVLSGFAMAGGDIVPVEPLADESGFYVGLGYGYIDINADYDALARAPFNGDTNHNSFMALAGYQINRYLAIEGRYWAGGDDSFTTPTGRNVDTDIDAWGIYVKPIYPVTGKISVYGLLGYAHVKYKMSAPLYSETWNEGGFSWGLGASYRITENFSIFADYTQLHHHSHTWDAAGVGPGPGTIKLDTGSWNIGFIYKF